MVSLSNHEAVLTDPPPGQFPELIPIPPNQRLFLLATPPLDLHLPFNGFRPGGKFLRKNKHYRPPFPRKRPWHSLLVFSKPSFQIPCSSRVIGAINTLQKIKPRHGSTSSPCPFLCQCSISFTHSETRRPNFRRMAPKIFINSVAS